MTAPKSESASRMTTQTTPAAAIETAMVSPTRDRMGATMPPRAAPLTYQSLLAVDVRGRPVTEDEELGVLWGMKPSAAHQLKLHAARRAADVIRLRRAKGEHERACAYAAPVEEAMAGLPCPDAEKREEIADGAEDVRQGEWRANPCKDTLRALLRARATMRQASLDHDRELVAKAPAEWEITL